ncbi:unnamed protein product [Prunus armeniaca]
MAAMRFVQLVIILVNVFKCEAYKRDVFSSAMQGISLEALRHRVVSRSATPSHALLRLLMPCNAFPALNVQLAKQPTAWGVFLPPRADARSGVREGMPLKTLILVHCP